MNHSYVGNIEITTIDLSDVVLYIYSVLNITGIFSYLVLIIQNYCKTSYI